MFLPGREDADPEKMSVRELAEMTLETINDPMFHEILGDFTVSKEQYVKLEQIVDGLLKKHNGKDHVTLESMKGFRAGLVYGLGLAAKLSVYSSQMQKAMESQNKEKVVNHLQRFAFPFVAVDGIVKNWDDDHWFDSLIKNAKIEPEPIKNTHDTSTTITKKGEEVKEQTVSVGPNKSAASTSGKLPRRK